MDDERDRAHDAAGAGNGVPAGLGRGLERALARLAIVDEHLRRMDEHVSRARAAERAAAAR
jgi:hypothetical protein